MSATFALILAAGKGTRMKSEKAKVLHEVLFVPMVFHVLDAIAGLDLIRTMVVVGHQQDAVIKTLAGYDVEHVLQEEQLGTGHAARCAEPYLAGQQGTVLILCGDIPLIRSRTIDRMLAEHKQNSEPLTVMTTHLADPGNYGRIIRNAAGDLAGIVEQKDATPEERLIKEINAGIYCVELPFLFEALARVNTNNKQGEMYLTDIVAIAAKAGNKINTFSCEDALEVLGVNSRLELAEAHCELQRRHNEELMLSGVTLLAPETAFIQNGVIIGADTCINANVQITGNTKIGGNCTIGPNTVIHESRINDNVAVPPLSHVRNQVLT
ncbi:MAG: NTP transferase domain-containing protein [Desulfobacterales bacterium]|nr:NTP transferase domain-containing protein [Desulfobacterales bacterium]